MTKYFFSVITMLLVTTACASDDDYFAVVIKTTSSKHEAIQIAKEASSKLGYAIAGETLKTPPNAISFIGLVVNVHQPKDNEFVVTSYVNTSRSDAMFALKAAQEYFKNAKLSKVQVDKDNLDPVYTMDSIMTVIILGSLRDYDQALARTKEISQKTGILFSTRGMIFDKGRGLIWPDDDPDEIYAGSYWGRRYPNDGEGITIERSSFYKGFTEGLYIIIGGICQSDEDAAKELKKFIQVVPDAYAKKTVIYMGCIH